ncbi:S9 family peptidase [Aquisediminimonas profunda]|uniref:S9 family peptidase n=1 Tax=Aquisediminimonas profunda TaxID=1550733 RepID=UPI001C6399E1|nr:DPP IV N-terminal domain-containing protein [Aquisediminimonas profunda]
MSISEALRLSPSEMNWSWRYDYAQSLLFAGEWVANGAVFPTWIDEDRFWYERRGNDGDEYRVVDASDGNTILSVARSTIAGVLSGYFGVQIDKDKLIVTDPRFDKQLETLYFSAHGKDFALTLASNDLRTTTKGKDLNWLLSPTGDRAVILRGYNLWLRHIESEDERALTTDGSEFFAYGDTPASMRGPRNRMGDNTPEALWSPDGRWLLTLQTDDRHVPELALANYVPAEGIRPLITGNRTSLPADPKVSEFRMLAIDVENGRQVEARYPRLSAVRMNTTPFAARLAWWGEDSRTAYFVDVVRGEKAAHIVAFDVATGTSRIVFSECAESYVEVSVNVYSPALVHPLTRVSELIWYSERTGHGHLYLYDLATGTCRHAITAGNWRVHQILHVDEERRELFFLAAGIAPDENPYVCKPCVVSLDGGDVRILSRAEGSHRIWTRSDFDLSMKRFEGFNSAEISGVSPGGSRFVETVSVVDGLPVSYLRDRNGQEIAVIEQARGDFPDHWQWPEPVECIAADRQTKTYGLLFKPVGQEDGRSYPLIELIYGGPQVSYVPHSSFADGSVDCVAYLDAASIAALGAYVLILDGRGTAYREQAFRTASYRAIQTASNLDDHVAAINQLGERYPAIDQARIGITGFSGGGFMTAHAALRYGDVYKVAVAGGGNYDQALFWHSWGERYHGTYDADHYAVQAAKTYADGLKGKLLFVHGLLDEGCHPAGLFQLTQALIEADKDFDTVILPRAGHDWTGYGQRRRLDYFVTHLFGGTPPRAKSFERPFDRLLAKVAASSQPLTAS